MPFHVFEIDESSLERFQALFGDKRKIGERVELKLESLVSLSDSIVGTY